MKRFHCIPAQELTPYVDRIWGWESEEHERISLPILLPGTGADMFFHYRAPFVVQGGDNRGESLPASHLICIRHRPIRLQPSSSIGFVAVRFRVGGLHRFVAAPGLELFDRHPSASDLWRKPGRELADGMQAPTLSISARARLLEVFLLGLLDISPVDDLATSVARSIYRSSASITIDGMARAIGLSRRQLERRVKTWTGQSPIEIRSFSRLQKTVRALACDPTLSVTDAALAQGFYDQSHFIRAFREIGYGSPECFRVSGGLTSHFYNTPWRDGSSLQLG
jgi:AraC-like DNA-binding protein